MRVFIPAVLWERLKNKTKKDIEEQAAYIHSCAVFYFNLSTYFPFKLEIVSSEKLNNINSIIENLEKEEKEKKELERLQQIEKEYNQLKQSISNIKEVLK